ncbi:hypothetical protein D9619_009830 [Psilocybe cf. subviscida]|uniref:NACHT domain-containing protein n=1 Tax=Psilocybe cf. subviscida TaxID=2480587 RepID=A0A8H5BM45_9AGAR|nr:hypothetical protein D9619_009830 [Psilocybe cf. subviscida]
MSSKNVFKKLFKKRINKNKARKDGTGDKTTGNDGTNLSMGSSTNVSGIGTAMNSEQESIEGHENIGIDDDNKKHKKDYKADVDDVVEESLSSVSGTVTGMNSQQGFIKDYEDTVKNKDNKEHGKGNKANVDDAKKMALAPYPTEGTLARDAAQPQEPSRLKNVAYEAVKESLRTVVRFSDSFPPLKSAGQAILEVMERYDAVKEIPKELAHLNEKLRLLVEILESGSRDMNDDRLGGLARAFDEKAKLIALKLDRSMASRIVETTQDRAFIAAEISSVMFAVDIAMLDVNVRNHKGISQLQETVLELNVRVLLDKLRYVEGAGFNHKDCQGCTKGTRIMLLADLLSWAANPENEHVFWLNGMAGTGKTTVAETFCTLLFDRGLLGSSFFCSRKRLDRRNVRLIIPALAKGLARAYPAFQTELLTVLKDDRDFTGLGLEDQYLMLILQPAEKAFASSSKMIVLVIDALDECEDAQAAEMFLKTVLLWKPTCGLRFLVTSRPEPKILKGFRSGAHVSLRLQDIEAHLVKADVSIFLGNKLKEVEDLYSEYSSTWPPAEVQTIVDHTGTLFIYAATAVKYISDDHGDPVERLAKFASIQPPVNAVEGIDEVYAYVLAEAFSYKLDNVEIARIKACLSTVESFFCPAFCGAGSRQQAE